MSYAENKLYRLQGLDHDYPQAPPFRCLVRKTLLQSNETLQ